MPAKIEYQEERTVGPSLGADSIRSGVRASLFGLLFVVVFMLFYYRGAGINAVVALILNMILMLAALVVFDATLTLPGIAGIILTIGMAVDSNVLIFESIREELMSGKTVASAVDQGFQRGHCDNHRYPRHHHYLVFVPVCFRHRTFARFRRDAGIGSGNKPVLGRLCFPHNFHVGVESQDVASSRLASNFDEAGSS